MREIEIICANQSNMIRIIANSSLCDQLKASIIVDIINNAMIEELQTLKELVYEIFDNVANLQRDIAIIPKQRTQDNTLILELKESYCNLLNNWKGKDLPYHEWFEFLRKIKMVIED